MSPPQPHGEEPSARHSAVNPVPRGCPPRLPSPHTWHRSWFLGRDVSGGVRAVPEAADGAGDAGQQAADVCQERTACPQPVPSVSPGMLAAVQQPFATATFTNRMGKLRHGGRGRCSMATNRSRSHRPHVPGGRSQELEAAPALPGRLRWLRLVPCWCAQLWGPTRKGPFVAVCSAWAEKRSHSWVPPCPPSVPAAPRCPPAPNHSPCSGGSAGRLLPSRCWRQPKDGSWHQGGLWGL